MRILVTGASGFVGSYLVPELSAHGHTVALTTLNSINRCDLSNARATHRLIHKIKPNAVVHLAGISQTKNSLFSPAEFFKANVLSTQNICAALTTLERGSTFLLASSGMVYGRNTQRCSETTDPKPASLYGLSKYAAEQVAMLFQSKKVSVYVARPFNHVGPSQSAEFAVASFANQISKAKEGGSITVGTLNSARDFTDVRDIVRAYRLILEVKPKERLFVLGSGRAVKIRWVLNKMIHISGKKLAIVTDSRLSSSKGISYMRCDPSLAQKVLSWRTKIPLEQSLRDSYFTALNASM